MSTIFDAFLAGLGLVFGLDSDLYEILWLSLRVSFCALAISTLIGLPLGAFLAVADFRGRQVILVIIHALMGLPPVVVGLMVYLFLSRSGPLGWLGLLYTPSAMIIAQTILVLPIITALSRQILAELNGEYREFFAIMKIAPLRRGWALVYDARIGLITVILAGFGRAISEVGAVIIVGGNIDHLTRVMTTAIALETARGDLELALGLGFVLLSVALIVNGLAAIVRNRIHQDAHL